MNAFCQTSFTHWTRLWTISKHINGTLCFVRSENLFQYFMHETDKCFSNLSQKKTICDLSARQVMAISSFIGKLHSMVFFFIIYARSVLLIITKVKMN